MENKKINGRTVFIAVLFFAAVFMLALKFMNPTPLLISGGGETIPLKTTTFTFTDAIIIMVSSFIVGISALYLLFFDFAEKPVGILVLEERKKRWEQIGKTLKENEQKIYKAIIESDGILEQSAFPEKTAISKSNVSRALDLLESRGLVEKRRRGMTNVILLK